MHVCSLWLFISVFLKTQVDLLEPVSHFLETARESLAPENHMVCETHKATNFFCVPLQVICSNSKHYQKHWMVSTLTTCYFISLFVFRWWTISPILVIQWFARLFFIYFLNTCHAILSIQSNALMKRLPFLTFSKHRSLTSLTLLETSWTFSCFHF